MAADETAAVPGETARDGMDPVMRRRVDALLDFVGDEIERQTAGMVPQPPGDRSVAGGEGS